jgi:hypothetical protein
MLTPQASTGTESTWQSVPGQETVPLQTMGRAVRVTPREASEDHHTVVSQLCPLRIASRAGWRPIQGHTVQTLEAAHRQSSPALCAIDQPCRASNLAEAWGVFSLWQGTSPAKTRASARPSCAYGPPPAPYDTLRAMERGTWPWNTQALSCGRHQSGEEGGPRRVHAPKGRRQHAISSEDAGPAPGMAGHERHRRLRSPGAAHVLDSSCLRHRAHHRLILGCPARLGPTARGSPWRGHGHTGERTTSCSPDT